MRWPAALLVGVTLLLAAPLAAQVRKRKGAQLGLKLQLSAGCPNALLACDAGRTRQAAAKLSSRAPLQGDRWRVRQQLLHVCVHGYPATWPCIHGCWWPLLGGARSTSARAQRGHGGQCHVAARSVQAAATRAIATMTLACATAQPVRNAWRNHCSRKTEYGMVMQPGGSAWHGHSGLGKADAVLGRTVHQL